MNPLILNKDHNCRGHHAGGSPDPRWLERVNDRCKVAQEHLAKAGDDVNNELEELRTLIFEDVPALVRRLKCAE